MWERSSNKSQGKDKRPNDAKEINTAYGEMRMKEKTSEHKH